MFQKKIHLVLIVNIAASIFTEGYTAEAQSEQAAFPAISLASDFPEASALGIIQQHLKTFKFVNFAKDLTCQKTIQVQRLYNEKWFTYVCKNAFSNAGNTPITLDAIHFIQQFVNSCTDTPEWLKNTLLWYREMLKIIHVFGLIKGNEIEIRQNLLIAAEKTHQHAALVKKNVPCLFNNILRYIVDNEKKYNEFSLWPNRLLNFKSGTPFSGESYFYLANAIRHKRVSTSESLETLDETNRYIESARLYRVAIGKGLGVACVNLAALINYDLIFRDENNQPFFPDQKNQVIIRLLEKAVRLGCVEAGPNLAQMKAMVSENAGNATDLATIQEGVKSGKASSILAFAHLIRDKKIHTDEENNVIREGTHYNHAARLLRRVIKLGKSEAEYALATLILEGHVTVDDNEQPFKLADRFEVAARLLRSVIQKNDMPTAYHCLAHLISAYGIRRDQNNNPIDDINAYQVAASMFIELIKSGENLSRNNLGILIMEGHINFDEKDVVFSESERYNVAARLFRESLSSEKSEALGNLAHLIRDGKIDRDENGRVFAEKDRYLVAARLYALNTSPRACTFLLGLYLRHPHAMQKNTDDEKMQLLMTIIKNAEKNIKKVAFNAAYTLYGIKSNHATIMSDLWNFTEFEWSLYEYLLDVQDAQTDLKEKDDIESLLNSEDDSDVSTVAKATSPKKTVDVEDDEKNARVNIDESFDKSLRNIVRKSAKMQAKDNRFTKIQQRIQNPTKDMPVDVESVRCYTFKQKAQDDLIALGFFSPTAGNTRSDMMYSLGEINTLEAATKAGRGFHKMVNAINTGEQRANAETLKHERLLDGTPLCTMEFNKKDRLVYTLASDGHITIWGASGHDQTIDQMRRQGLLQ